MLAPDKLNPRSSRRNWRSLLPLFEIARLLYANEIFVAAVWRAKEAEPLARCEPRVVLFLAALPRVIQIRRRLILALRLCGRISKVVALRQSERIVTLGCLPT